MLICYYRFCTFLTVSLVIINGLERFWTAFSTKYRISYLYTSFSTFHIVYYMRSNRGHEDTASKTFHTWHVPVSWSHLKEHFVNSFLMERSATIILKQKLWKNSGFKVIGFVLSTLPSRVYPVFKMASGQFLNTGSSINY